MFSVSFGMDQYGLWMVAMQKDLHLGTTVYICTDMGTYSSEAGRNSISNLTKTKGF